MKVDLSLLISTQDLFHGLKLLILGNINLEKESIDAYDLLEKAQCLSSYIDCVVSKSCKHRYEDIHVHLPWYHVLFC